MNRHGRFAVSIIVVMVLLALVAVNLAPSIVAKHHIAIKARQQAERQDIARIASTDPKTWSGQLLGKPVKYLEKLGLQNYHPTPNHVLDGPGERLVTSSTGLMWIVVTSQKVVTFVDGPWKKVK